MDRLLLGTGSITHTTTTNPTESDIKTAVAQLLGYEERYLTVTFKNIPQNQLRWTNENLLYWGDTPNWDDLTGQIIIEFDKNVWHISEINAHYSSSSSHPYDHTIPVKGGRLILDRNTCLTTWGGSAGNYRLILPLNYWDKYVWTNIESANANNKDIFYINHGTDDPSRIPLDPPSISEYNSEGWAEQYIVNGTRDYEGLAFLDQWAKDLGFLLGTAHEVSDTEHWVKLSWYRNPSTGIVSQPSLYIKGFAVVFKTAIPHTKIKFVAPGSAASNSVYMESDYNGQIVFSWSDISHNTKDGVPYGSLFSLREINISMQAESCYQWDNQPIEGFINLTDDYTQYAPNNPLPLSAETLKDEDIDQLITDDWFGAKNLLEAYGGMVDVQNFEILKNSNPKNYRGFSPLYTRWIYQQTEGNFVFDNSIIRERTSVYVPPFNKNYQWNITRPIPIIISDNMSVYDADSVTITNKQVYQTFLEEVCSVADYDPIKDRVVIYRKNADFDNWQDAVNKLAPVYTTINPETWTPSCWDCTADYISMLSLWDFTYWLMIATTAADYNITINTSCEIFEVNNNVFDTKTVEDWISSSTTVPSTYPRYNIYYSIIKTKQVQTSFTWGEDSILVPGYTYDQWANNHRVTNSLPTGDIHSYLDFTKKLNYNFTINDWGLLHYSDDMFGLSFTDASLTAYSDIFEGFWGMYFDKAVRVHSGTLSGYKTLFEHWPHSIINPSCAYSRSPGEISSSANGQRAYLSLADCGWEPGTKAYGYIVVLWKNVCQ